MSENSKPKRSAPADVDFESFFSLSTDMLCIAGFDGRFKLVNPAWERTLGWTVEELTRRPWSDFVHPDDLESTIAEANRQTELGLDAIRFENRYLAKDGSYRWLLWNSRPCHERAEMHAIARDVTESRLARQNLSALNEALEAQVAERTAAAEERALQAEQAQRELRASEQQIQAGADRMRYFLQQMPLAVALVDDQMNYAFLSERFRSDYAFDEGAALNHKDIFPNDVEKWRLVYDRCQAGEAQQSDEEAFVLRKGRVEWLRWRADPWRTPAGEIRGMVFYSEVITARKEAESQVRQTTTELARSNAEMEAFTYSVSHDLKEPLRTIEAFSQFLLEDYADSLNDQGRDYLQKMARASARMKQLIEDLLALSRIGRRDDLSVVADPNRLVADVIEGMRATIDQRSATVLVEAHLPTVRGDAARLEQIFGNLVGNGIKFNRSTNPLVEVGVREQTATDATFFVHDNGVGIAPEYHERIFGIFQRLHRREEFEGTGAGLAIVRRAVETLGGRVWVESDGTHGTSFLFKLPLPVDGASTIREAA